MVNVSELLSRTLIRLRTTSVTLVSKLQRYKRMFFREFVELLKVCLS